MNTQIYDTMIDSDRSLTLARIRRDEITDLSPLHVYLDRHGLWQHFSAQSTNFKGYVCKWEIMEGKLYLASFKSFSPRLNKTAQIFGDMPIVSDGTKNEKGHDLLMAIKQVESGICQKIGLDHSKYKEVRELIDELYDISMQLTPLKHNDEIDYDASEDTTKVFVAWFTGDVFAYHSEQDQDEGYGYRFEDGVLMEKIPQYIKRYNTIG
ncbi:MAG: hypothetical protein JHC35_05420 [Sulfuricurvum sp.]|jgi:hypothetical protein|uniref:hypothetical protein n=1 Tax=Sulfuricurvum sp. TaxID=2025608 RepID=UPI0025FEB2EA|nr:hypothetical protein [Sulfuricurvum sp.]MCI4406716.1 hypothetical protein [Sulfuricurvum sp.]